MWWTDDIHTSLYEYIHIIMFIMLYEKFKQIFPGGFDYPVWTGYANSGNELSSNFLFGFNTNTRDGFLWTLKENKWKKKQPAHRSSRLFWPIMKF